MRELIEDLIVLAKLEERDDAEETTDVADVAAFSIVTRSIQQRGAVTVAVEDAATIAGRDGEIYGALDAPTTRTRPEYGAIPNVRSPVFCKSGRPSSMTPHRTGKCRRRI